VNGTAGVNLDGVDPDFAVKMLMLKEVFEARSYQASDFEISLFSGLFERHSPAAVRRALQQHVMTSPFAPKVDELAAMLEPENNMSPEAVFEALREAVRRFGPYQKPVGLSDVHLRLIELLGGWDAVNLQLPDSVDTYAVKTYKDRMGPLIRVALSQVTIHRAVPAHSQLIERGYEPKPIGEQRQLGFSEMERPGRA